jgi:hypothetical protein
MLWIRPAAAHRVTVLGSTRKSAATSPGVSRRSRGSIVLPRPQAPGPAPATGSCWSTGLRSRPLAAGRCPRNGSTNLQPGNRSRCGSPGAVGSAGCGRGGPPTRRALRQCASGGPHRGGARHPRRGVVRAAAGPAPGGRRRRADPQNPLRFFARPMYQGPGQAALLGSWERRIPRSGGARGGAAGTWLLGGRWETGAALVVPWQGPSRGQATATSRVRPGTAGGLLGGRPPAPGVPPARGRVG